MKDNYSEEEFAPIAAAMKELPYFAPSPHFADRVMARVRVAGAEQVPAGRVSSIAAAQPQAIAPQYSRSYAPAIDRRAPAMVPQTDVRRSIPARLAATALVVSLGVTMTTVALVAFFNLDILLLVSRVFGSGAVSFITALATDASATATATAAGAAASAGTAAGAAIAGSFVAGAVAATAVLRAAASASRRAA